jgi:DNA-binding protein H-NS
MLRSDGYPGRNIHITRAQWLISISRRYRSKNCEKGMKDLAKAISTYEDRHKAEARAKQDAIAKEMGYSLADLIGAEVKATRVPAVAKYRHPENAAVTWSGRGRKPQWFADHVNTGKDPGLLAI